MQLRVAGVVSTFAAAVLAASASAATPLPVEPDGPPATAALSSTTAGAKPVALTLKVHYEMVCGRPGPGKAVVTLPAAVFVPHTIGAAAVLVNGKPSPFVSVSGHDVSIAMPLKRSGVSCMSIGPGTLTLVLTKKAGIGNPAAAGTYMIRVHRNRLAFSASVAISA